MNNLNTRTIRMLFHEQIKELTMRAAEDDELKARQHGC